MASKRTTPRAAKTPSPLGRRLRWTVDTSGLSVDDFASRAGLTRTLLYQLFAGDNQSTSTDNARALAKVGRVDLVWLITGEGSPGRGDGWPAGEPSSSQPPAAQPAPPAAAATKAEEGRWQYLAGLSADFAAAATEALDAGASPRLLDAAADRLRDKRAVSYEEAVAAIDAASAGVAAFRAKFFGDELPGSFSPRLIGEPGKAKSPTR